MMRMANERMYYDLSVLAPRLLPGEALSSWLVRLAEMHRLTVSELQEVIGFPLTAFERGNITGLDRVFAMAKLSPLSGEAIASPDLLAHPMPPGPAPPAGWAVCKRCLRSDSRAGRPPYVRLRWLHPLATHCDAHREPLTPHGNTTVKVASASTLWGGKKAPIVEAGDELLEAANFDEPAMLSRVREHLSGRYDVDQTIKLRSAVRDITAALAVRMDRDPAFALMSLFERPLLGRGAAPGGRWLEREWWARVDAARRLLYVRVALLALAEPVDPTAKERKWPLASDWLAWRYGHLAPGWQSVFAHASLDPLLLMALELPRGVVSELCEASLAWPTDLRRRWTYAAAAVAMGAVSS